MAGEAEEEDRGILIGTLIDRNPRFLARFLPDGNQEKLLGPQYCPRGTEETVPVYY